MATRVRKQIYVDREQEARLKRLARITGLPEAALIRQAIASELARARRDERARGVDDRSASLDRVRLLPVRSHRWPDERQPGAVRPPPPGPPAA